MLSTDSLPNADQTTRKAMTPNRRSVVRAAAWATPAVVVASAAPAFADSTGAAPILNSRSAGGSNGSLELEIDGTLKGDIAAFYSLTRQQGTVRIPALVAVIQISGSWIGNSAEFFDYEDDTAPPYVTSDSVVLDGLLWEVTTLQPGRITFSTAGGVIPGEITRVNTPRVFVLGALGTGPDGPALSISLSGITGASPSANFAPGDGD